MKITIAQNQIIAELKNSIHLLRVISFGTHTHTHQITYIHRTFSPL
jgi:hypothetical protein